MFWDLKMVVMFMFIKRRIARKAKLLVLVLWAPLDFKMAAIFNVVCPVYTFVYLSLISHITK